jgi:hypothetical protein
MENATSMAYFVKFFSHRMSFVFSKYSSEKGRAVPHPGDADTLADFIGFFPAFTFYASMATTALACQLVGVRKNCETPVVTFNLSVPTEVSENTHHRHGRIILLEFPSILIACRSAADTGPNNADKIIQRRADDKAMTEFLENQSRVSQKPLGYFGDLDVCRNVNRNTGFLAHSTTPSLVTTERPGGVW